jgi:hypothetical protein
VSGSQRRAGQEKPAPAFADTAIAKPGRRHVYSGKVDLGSGMRTCNRRSCSTG